MNFRLTRNKTMTLLVLFIGIIFFGTLGQRILFSCIGPCPLKRQLFDNFVPAIISVLIVYIIWSLTETLEFSKEKIVNIALIVVGFLLLIIGIFFIFEGVLIGLGTLFLLLGIFKFILSWKSKQ